jgi:hypothetical protein
MAEYSIKRIKILSGRPYFHPIIQPVYRGKRDICRFFDAD